MACTDKKQGIKPSLEHFKLPDQWKMNVGVDDSDSGGQCSCVRVDTFPACHALRWTLYALPWWCSNCPPAVLMTWLCHGERGPREASGTTSTSLTEVRALCMLDKLVQSHIHSFFWSLRWSVTKLPRLTLNSLSRMTGATMPVANQSSAHSSCANCLTVLFKLLNGNSSTWSVRLGLH